MMQKINQSDPACSFRQEILEKKLRIIREEIWTTDSISVDYNSGKVCGIQLNFIVGD